MAGLSPAQSGTDSRIVYATFFRTQVSAQARLAFNDAITQTAIVAGWNFATAGNVTGITEGIFEKDSVDPHDLPLSPDLCFRIGGNTGDPNAFRVNVIGKSPFSQMTSQTPCHTVQYSEF